jgi:hypothetical protein
MSLALLNSPAEVIRQLLITLSLGVIASYDSKTGLYNGQPWPVFTDGEPSSPDSCITVYDTTPIQDGRAMYDGEVWFHYGFQIRIRASASNPGYVKAESIHHALSEAVYINLVAISPAVYRVPCVSSNGILRLGKDSPKTKRSLFTINCKSPIQRVT